MRGSMVDIQSATAENRRGKRRKKKKLQRPNIWPVLLGGRTIDTVRGARLILGWWLFRVYRLHI